MHGQPRRLALARVEPAIQAARQYALAVAQLAGFDHDGRVDLHGHVARLSLDTQHLENRHFKPIDGTRRTQRTEQTHGHFALPTGGQVYAQQPPLLVFGNGPMVLAREKDLLELQTFGQIGLHAKDGASLDV